MEKVPKINISQKDTNDSVEFIRHSKSSYKTYGDILKSENPKAEFDKENQSTPDLTGAGIEMAKQEAESFFGKLNPDTDSLFIASSNEARAIETANIYRTIAHTKGFMILKPEHARSGLSEELAEGEIRVIDSLSINSKYLLIESLFNSPAKRGDINWGAVEPEFKAKYDEASKIIEADDQGSYGGNLAKHGEKIKVIFPEIETAEELFNEQFQNLKRLAKFGVKKAQESGHEKNIKILAFGHENYLMHVIQDIFQEEGINNCETMHIEVEGENIVANFRGKEANL
ncbi:MAG: hypothetical protein WC848_04290 [Parcubacteria group bacterium]|jgi:hypothetical protein